MSQESTPVEIFCSYAHEDEVWLRKLETFLREFQNDGLISFWHDRLIIPGTSWAKSIDTHLEAASVVLLLVSTDFFASDYCVGIEMKRAIERQEAGQAFVIPIVVREVDWEKAPFAHLQVLPTNARPIATWQDEHTALSDVAAGIRRAIEELPLLSASTSRTALPAIWNIPYARNSFFTGRDDEFALLRSHLQVGHTTVLAQPQAISGLGGIGKTQLALEYAYRAHQDYQAVLWARAESTEALISSYTSIAALLRLPESKAREQNITVQAVKTWLQTNQNWLLILDNADDLSLLLDFLPSSPGGHLLLTTRASTMGQLAQRLEIQTLLPEQGALFLLRRAALLAPGATFEQIHPAEQELALQITRELGGLPLALDQVGAYLEETGADLAAYWQIYQQRHTELLRRRGGLLTDHPEPVATTWALSFQKVKEKNPAAIEVLRLCAYLAPDSIAEELIVQGAPFLGPVLSPVAADAFLLNQAIEVLRAYSLVRRDPRRKSLSVHRLVQAVVKDELSKEEQYQWLERAVQVVHATFPKSEYTTWQECERLLPHALLIAQFIENERIISSEAGHLLHRTASYLLERANLQEAKSLYQHALLIWNQTLDPKHPDIAATLHDLGILYRGQGQYKEAETYLQHALLIYRQSLGINHPDTAATLHDVGGIHLEQGQYKEAEAYFQLALLIRKQVQGSNHPDIAATLHNLGVLYHEQGQYKKAVTYLQHALFIKEQVLGADHPSTAMTLSPLALLYVRQSRYIEAEVYLQRALLISEQVQGPNHPDTAEILHIVGSLYWRQRRYKESEAYLQRALLISKQIQGFYHPDTSGILLSLGLIYSEQGQFKEAENCYQQAIAINQQEVISNHSLVGRVYEAYALFLVKRKQPFQAAYSYKQAIKSLGLRRAIHDFWEVIHIYMWRSLQKK